MTTNTFETQLEQFMDKVRDAARPSRTTLRKVGVKWNKRIKQQFRAGKDPYGRAWDRNEDGSTPLVESRHLMNSFDFSIQGYLKLIIGSPVPYADIHQLGSGFVRQRVMLPHRRTLPANWQDDIRYEMGQNVLRAMA